MKLKSAIAAMLIVTSMSSFAIDLTMSPVYTVVAAVRATLATAVSPVATTAVTVNGGNAMIMKAVRNDALNYIADGESTDRLDTAFTELRKIEGLETASNTELSKLIVLSVD